MEKYVAIICILLGFISGCQSHTVQEKNGHVIVNPDFSSHTGSVVENYDAGFHIKGKNQAGKLLSSLRDGRWSLGSITVEHWPLSLNFCKWCNVDLGRRYHPDGVTQWLKLINEIGKTLFVVSSYQKQFHALGWHFLHEGNKVKIIQSRSKSETIIDADIHTPFALNAGEVCSLLWANKHYLTQPAVGISNDVAQFRSQFIIQCDS